MDQTYTVTGFVQSVAPAERQLTVSHEPIPGFMPAMTMSFDVAEGQSLDGVAPGARIEFRLHRTESLLRIESLKVLSPAPAGAAAPALPLAESEAAPDFALTDQDGRPAKLSDWRGDAVLVDFVFTRCPGPCPIQTARLVEVQKQLDPKLARRTRFASISLDPAYDSPERMRAYALSRGAALDNWSFLTGEPAAVQSVLDAWRIGTVRQPDGSLDHVVATFLVGPDGRIAKRYLGLEGPSSAILADLAQLLP
ncbi:MAG TPA: SCO family protein [Myxococcota bacterium]|nr:SCO family protein [Myxococcota bacterium]